MSTALGSAICAGAAIKPFGWGLKNPASLKEVNVAIAGKTEILEMKYR